MLEGVFYPRFPRVIVAKKLTFSNSPILDAAVSTLFCKQRVTLCFKLVSCIISSFVAFVQFSWYCLDSPRLAGCHLTGMGSPGGCLVFSLLAFGVCTPTSTPFAFIYVSAATPRGLTCFGSVHKWFSLEAKPRVKATVRHSPSKLFLLLSTLCYAQNRKAVFILTLVVEFRNPKRTKIV